MTVLMQILLSIVPVLFLSYDKRTETFYLARSGLAMSIVALLVTVFVEVAIVKQITKWTVSTLPVAWQEPREG